MVPPSRRLPHAGVTFVVSQNEPYKPDKKGNCRVFDNLHNHSNTIAYKRLNNYGLLEPLLIAVARSLLVFLITFFFLLSLAHYTATWAARSYCANFSCVYRCTVPGKCLSKNVCWPKTKWSISYHTNKMMSPTFSQVNRLRLCWRITCNAIASYVLTGKQNCPSGNLVWVHSLEVLVQSATRKIMFIKVKQVVNTNIFFSQK